MKLIIIILVILLYTSCSDKTTEPRVCPMWNTKGFEQKDTLTYN